MAYSVGNPSLSFLQLHSSSDLCASAPFPGRVPQASLRCCVVKRAVTSALRVRAHAVSGANSWEEPSNGTWNTSKGNGNEGSKRNKLPGVRSPTMASIVSEKTRDTSRGNKSIKPGAEEGQGNSINEEGQGNSINGVRHDISHDQTSSLDVVMDPGDSYSQNSAEQQEIESCLGDTAPLKSSEDGSSGQETDSISTFVSKNTEDNSFVSDTDTSHLVISDSANDPSCGQSTTPDNNFDPVISENYKSASENNLEAEISLFQDLTNETSDPQIVSESDVACSQGESQENGSNLMVEEHSKEGDSSASIDFGSSYDCSAVGSEPSISSGYKDSQDSHYGEIKSTSSDVKAPITIKPVRDDSDSFDAQILDGSIPSEQTDVSNSHIVETNGLNNRRESILESDLLNLQPEQIITSSGLPAPIRPAGLSITSSKVLIPAAIDHIQAQAFAALQALKVIEPGADPSALCTRREYARWLITSSGILARNPESKVFPAMFIENSTELAFDDVTPSDPDFPYIQGLAEAGLISSRLLSHSPPTDDSKMYTSFSPDSPLSRQDLVSWKIAMERRGLPEVDFKALWEKSGFLDADKIHKDAWPALFADLSSEQSIVGVAFGYTRLFQPDKPVTRAQAAAALATGEAAELVSEELARIEAETVADNAVAAHAALEAQVQEDLNASFKRELDLEREKIRMAEKTAEEALQELEKIRNESEKDVLMLMKEQAELDSEREFLSTLRQELEEQLQSFSESKLKLSFEKDELDRLRKEAEKEKQALVQIRSEVEVEKKALALARSWVEEEAKKASVHAKVLQEARERWEKQGIKVFVDKELEDVTDSLSSLVLRIEDQKKIKQPESTLDETSAKDNLKLYLTSCVDKLKNVLERLIQVTGMVESSLKERAVILYKRAHKLQEETIETLSKASQNVQEVTTSKITSLKTSVIEGTQKIAVEFKGQTERLSQKFKS
eukprot:TRINITY_DN374_c0_g1_i3.p1 TRINITY_DN374_c0_g1~~TRINITY_DN374_c0_g1_i3.p1  ORF type:complete len:958 (+),score=269.95 TRINITY_DN374_c0_g1_i3:295-3168(+)